MLTNVFAIRNRSRYIVDGDIEPAEVAMGYNLQIGEFDTSVYPEDRYIRAIAEDEEHEDAPANSSGDRSNLIMPSYSAWSGFSEAVSLSEVFYSDRQWRGHNPLIRQHPGAEALTGDHLEAFRAAKDRAETELTESDRESIQRADDEPTCVHSEGFDWTPSLGHYIRARWLVYWTEWALEHCDYPTFANS